MNCSWYMVVVEDSYLHSFRINVNRERQCEECWNVNHISRHLVNSLLIKTRKSEVPSEVASYLKLILINCTRIYECSWQLISLIISQVRIKNQSKNYPYKDSWHHRMNAKTEVHSSRKNRRILIKHSSTLLLKNLKSLNCILLLW